MHAGAVDQQVLAVRGQAGVDVGSASLDGKAADQDEGAVPVDGVAGDVGRGGVDVKRYLPSWLISTQHGAVCPSAKGEDPMGVS
jgi:hypothetical protein